MTNVIAPECADAYHALVISSLWLRWTLNCACGELIGIGIAGGIAYGVNSLIGEPQTLTFKLIVLGTMMIAGFLEGGFLGYFQWRVIKLKFARIRKKDWMTYTIAIAMLGWFLGMLPSLFFIEAEPTSTAPNPGVDLDNPLLFALMCVVAGLIVGALFGVSQWFVLRRHTGKAWKWIVANALGWGAGLGWIYLVASLPDAGTNLLSNIALGLMGGILAGLSVGAITGIFLVRLQPSRQQAVDGNHPVR